MNAVIRHQFADDPGALPKRAHTRVISSVDRTKSFRFSADQWNRPHRYAAGVRRSGMSILELAAASLNCSEGPRGATPRTSFGPLLLCAPLGGSHPFATRPSVSLVANSSSDSGLEVNARSNRMRALT
jgi:hypothetical protein